MRYEVLQKGEQSGLTLSRVSCLPESASGSRGRHRRDRKRLVKNLPAVQETLVQFLGQEDPLVKG